MNFYQLLHQVNQKVNDRWLKILGLSRYYSLGLSFSLHGPAYLLTYGALDS